MSNCKVFELCCYFILTVIVLSLLFALILFLYFVSFFFQIQIDRLSNKNYNYSILSTPGKQHVQPTTTPTTTTTTATTTTQTQPTETRATATMSTLVCGRSFKRRSKRIINGREADAHSMPWLASISTKFQTHFCGGVLIHSQFILTAAHCFDNITSNNVLIRLGIHNLNNIDFENVYGIEKLFIHKRYDRLKMRNDIALIKLKRPILESKTVMPICLPYSNDSSKYTVIAGWGSDILNSKQSYLKEAKLRLLSDLECEQFIRKLDGHVDQDKIHCAIDDSSYRKSNACFGDSGGPVSLVDTNGQWYLIGIMSTVVLKSFSLLRECDNSKPLFYTNVSEYLDWILFHINISYSSRN